MRECSIARRDPNSFAGAKPARQRRDVLVVTGEVPRRRWAMRTISELTVHQLPGVLRSSINLIASAGAHGRYAPARDGVFVSEMPGRIMIPIPRPGIFPFVRILASRLLIATEIIARLKGRV